MKENLVLKPFIHKLELGIKPVFLPEQLERNDDVEILQQELQMTRNQNLESSNTKTNILQVILSSLFLGIDEPKSNSY